MNHKEATKQSFKDVKEDITELKKLTYSWIHFLNNSVIELNERLSKLEKKAIR